MKSLTSSTLLLVFLLGGCASVPPGPPPATTPEQAVTREMAVRLGKPVRLRVEHDARQDNWAFLTGVPLSPGGERFDYSNTPWADAVAAGDFDDQFLALARRRSAPGEGWQVIELSIGATDAPFVDWFEQYELPLDLASD